MRLSETEVVDTFAEAFPMWGARIVITAESPAWADEAARSMTGFATSVIGCKCEAGIERELDAGLTPDGRPGVSVLLFANDREGLAKRLVERIGQSVLTCPTTACFNGLDADETVDVGGQLRFFGDGYQASKLLDGRRYWRVPVMEGEFLVEERFAVAEGVAGGNIILLGPDVAGALRAAEAAAAAMRAVRDVILPFPGGIVRSGSKVGSRYSGLVASTNESLCPTLRAQVPDTDVPPDVGSVFEIVIDGLTLEAVRDAMARGLEAAARAGASHVTAGNYGGNLGPYYIDLRELLPEEKGGMTRETGGGGEGEGAGGAGGGVRGRGEGREYHLVAPLTLTLREQPAVPLETEGISPDGLAGRPRGEIEALTVWHGNRREQLGDFFAVSGNGDGELRVEGDLRRVKFLGRHERRPAHRGGQRGHAHRRGHARGRAGRRG